jgi:hypothetical protein
MRYLSATEELIPELYEENFFYHKKNKCLYFNKASNSAYKPSKSFTPGKDLAARLIQPSQKENSLSKKLQVVETKPTKTYSLTKPHCSVHTWIRCAKTLFIPRSRMA